MQSVPAATDLVIDGVVGISGSGPLRPTAAEVFAAVDEAGIPVVAVDIPSGVDVQTGAVDGPAVHAALTVTFGGLKPVHALGDCGRVELVDIGLDLPPTDMLGFDAADVAARWPDPGAARTTSTPRASPASWPARRPIRVRPCCAPAPRWPPPPAWCATREALHSKCFRTGPRSSPRRAPAAAGRVQAWVVGPGLGTDDAGAAALWFALETDLPVIVDADALTILAAHPDLRRQPRGADGVDAACRGVRAAGRARRPATIASPPPAGWPTSLGATVLLKGNVTVIAEPGGPVYLNPAGQSWAATAGSGDVLSGIIGALLAAGLPAGEAAAAAAFVHARAANLSAADPGPQPGADVGVAHPRPRPCRRRRLYHERTCHVAQAHSRPADRPGLHRPAGDGAGPVAADARRVRWIPTPPTGSSTTS